MFTATKCDIKLQKLFSTTVYNNCFDCIFEMNPTFTIKLDQQVYSGLVVTGKCESMWITPFQISFFIFHTILLPTVDGKVPSIACATTGGKILIHSPHEVTNTDGKLNAIRYLNLNRKITALAAGKVACIDCAFTRLNH